MKKLVQGLVVVVAFVGISAGTAFGWAWATHGYIVEQIGLDRLPAESNEIYGSVAPDTFNFFFSNPALMEVLATATHIDAEAPWAFSRNQPEREFAFGFASHNEAWGADMTAHQYGLTFGGPQFGKGYIVAKADVLLSLGYGDVFSGMGLPPEAAGLMAHILVENAIDLMLAEKYPEIGKEISRAALHRNQLFPKLMADSYGHLAPEEVFVAVEEGFRSNLIAYGQMLEQPPEIAHQMMAALLVGQAKAYLALFPGVPVPDDAQLFALADSGLMAGKLICGSDYETELEATVVFVRNQMDNRGISY